MIILIYVNYVYSSIPDATGQQRIASTKASKIASMHAGRQADHLIINLS